MTTYKMNLSTTEPNNYIGMVNVRQYDTESQIFEATITENGKPVDLTGLTVFFCVKSSPKTGLGISEQLVEDVDATAGIVRHTLTDYDMQSVGPNYAYFAFRKKEGEGFRYKHQFSTKDFLYNVKPSIFSDGIHDSNYIWTFEEILRYFQEWVEESMKTYDDWYLAAQEELERIIAEFNSWIAANQDIYDEWISNQKADFTDWLHGNKTDFLDWFESIRDILDENAAGNLQNQFDKINPDSELIELRHDTKSYPQIRTLYWEYGMATAPLEYEPTDIGIGGGNVHTINSAVEYLDRHSMKIYVPRYYKLVNPELILLKNAVRLISDYRVLQIEFDSDVNPSINLSLTADFKGKVYGSLVENPHVAKMVTAQTLQNPGASVFYELIQTRIDGLKELNDGKLYTVTNSTNKNMLQVEKKWNVVEAIDRQYPELFKNLEATTLEEKVIAARKFSTIVSNIWGFGSAANSSNITIAYGNGSVWEGFISESGSTMKQISLPIPASCIQDDGYIHVLAHADAANETTVSALSVDYTNLEIQFKYTV